MDRLGREFTTLINCRRLSTGEHGQYETGKEAMNNFNGFECREHKVDNTFVGHYRTYSLEQRENKFQFGKEDVDRFHRFCSGFPIVSARRLPLSDEHELSS